MKLNRMMLKVATAAVTLMAFAPAAFADTPMIEIGGGAEGAPSQGTVDVLLRVGFGVRGSATIGTSQLIYARMSGDISFAPSDSGQQVPYMDIQFIPAQTVDGTLTNDGILNGTGYSTLPVRVRRDLRLDEQVDVSVDVVGVQAGGVQMSGNGVGVYAQVAADALGYKMASHVSNLVTFQGVHLGSIGAEVGVFFQPNDDFKVRLAMGGQGDLGMGWHNTDSGFGLISQEQTNFTAYSDFSAYAEVRVDIAKFIEVFARASLNGAWNYEDNVDNNLTHYIQVMGGIAFIY